MLTRIYADNFRCLVNFDLKLDRLTLLMGPNGSGKTSVFDVLRRLQGFLFGNARTTEAFPAADLTRWMDSLVQRFELDLSIEGRAYRYGLTVDHTRDGRKSRVQEETLTADGIALFRFVEGEAQLYRDNGSTGPIVGFDWERSGIGILPSRPDNTKLTAFRQEVERIVIASICPVLMEGISRSEDSRLSARMENFASWYRRLAQEDIEAVIALFEDLKNALPGFRSLSLVSAGEDTRDLKAVFDLPGNSGKTMAFNFRELSDGQRVLIALYTLLHGIKNNRLTLLLDEPDNYVSLREIQPWLLSLQDACGMHFEQAVLISHHPEIINYLGASNGQWLQRADAGHVQVKDAAPAITDGLTLAETIARGWVDEN